MEPVIANYRIPFEQEDQWQEHLKREGFVVVANYLPQAECNEYVAKSWDIMEHLAEGKLNRKDQSTQKLSNCYPPVLHGGMIQYVGHSQLQWDLRKRCKPIFARIWQTDKLKTSFDGFCFMNGVRNYKPRPADSFMHCDQSGTKDYLWSYQGLISLTDCDRDGGGFVVVPRSHLYHHEFMAKKKLLEKKDDWYLMEEKDKLEAPFKHHIKLDTLAGDFILWDSRTFHCNTVPTTPTLRICVYICMLPSKKIPENIQKKREKGVVDRRTSTHHPGDGFRLFPVLPRFVQDRDHFLELVQDINTFKSDKEIEDMI